MAFKKDTQAVLDAGGFIEKSRLCGAAGGESDWEYMVLSAGGEGWYVTGGFPGDVDREQMLIRLGFCAELSLTVPITNSLAFLFTVLGEWWAEGKVITRGWTLPILPIPHCGGGLCAIADVEVPQIPG